MASLANSGLIFAIFCLVVLTTDVHANKPGPAAEESSSFLRDVCQGKEKLVKLHFYVQDLRIGHVNTTVFEVAKASITPNSKTAFGSVHVLDDLVTEGPAFNSKVLGRTQGLTTNADLSTIGVAMNLNFVFTAGRFNGSTLCILGRNAVFEPERELPVVGGTGAFRFTRGYAIQTTYSINMKTNYAVLEYTIYVTVNSNTKVNRIEDVEIADM